MTTQPPAPDGFQLDELGPPSYHRQLVPRFFAPLADGLLGSTPPHVDENILDLACGTGVVARRAAHAVGSGRRVIGIDLNPSMIDFARSGGDLGQSDIEWLVGDAGKLPLPDAWAQVCYCQQGWQFFADQRRVAGELARVCSPGARIALAMWRAIEHNPVFALLVGVLDQVAGAQAAATMRAPFAGPAEALLREQLMAAGFDRVEVRISTLEVRFRSIRQFLRCQAAGSPLGPALQAVDEQVLAALAASLDSGLEPYTDDDGLLLPMQTWLVTGRRGDVS